VRRGVVLAAAVAVLLIIAGAIFVVGPPLLKSSSSSGPPSTTGSSASSQGAASSSALGEDWTTYHGNNARTGYQQVANFTSVTKDWNSTHLDGIIFAEPLVYGGDVFVATENNSVYALSAQTGSVVWHKNLGEPVISDILPCGDIVPVTGITGTPVIDPSTGTLYVVSYNGVTVSHLLSAINVSTGAVLWQRGADPPGSVVTAQQERSALSLANGMIYIPYGGLAGDCAQYYGWVVGIPANGTGSMVFYKVPTTREGGIWAPSGLAIDPSGNVYAATGNGASITTYDHGDSVIKLSANLTEEGYFAPTNWSVLNQNDADLGSLGPAIVGPNLLFQIGKEGVGYILNSSQLDGIGKQLYSSSVCDESFGGTAFSSPLIFVPCINGLVVLQLGDGNFTAKLLISGLNAGPPTVTDGIVWTIDSNSGLLYGFSTSSGHQDYTFSLGPVEHFTSSAAGDGRLFVAATNIVESFSLG
jgi:outer membrane protein assembly factor BamB